MGRPRTSRLAPLLASEAAWRVLAAIFLSPESMHVRGISDRTQLPYSVVQREVERLEKQHLVKSQKFATARVVRPNSDHPLFQDLWSMLLKTYGPREVLAEVFADEPDLDDAYVYGSWAARYQGESGAPPADVDVLLVGHVGPRRREELEAEAEDLLGQPVQIEVVSPRDWNDGRKPLVQTIKKRPLVEIRS
jgi:predicted nucleotidyltransferase